MAEVYWSIDARRDLRDVLTYIAADSPSAAREFVDRLIAAGSSLAAFPERGRHLPEVDDPELRELIVANYRLIYRLRADVVSIAAVMHAARDLSSPDRL